MTLLNLLVLFIILQILDVYSTYICFSKGAREVNPIVRFVIQRLGFIPGLVILKGIVCYIAYKLYIDYPVDADSFKVFYILNIIYVLVVVNNFNVYRKLK
jgi:hypothetical protein